jgi:hypothetical protein
VFKTESSILEWWLLLGKFGCDENLFSRSDANKFAMSRLDDARELLGYRRGVILIISFSIFLVAFQSELLVLERFQVVVKFVRVILPENIF